MWPFRRQKRPALPLPADQLRAIDAQIAAVLDRFEYDYLYFNINTFMDGLLAGRTKPFRLLFQPLHSDIYGLWVGFEHADYIVVNNALVRDLMRHTALFLSLKLSLLQSVRDSSFDRTSSEFFVPASADCPCGERLALRDPRGGQACFAHISGYNPADNGAVGVNVPQAGSGQPHSLFK